MLLPLDEAELDLGRLACMRLVIDPLGTWALQRHGIEILDGQAVASQARKIKTAEEIKAVRNAVAVCDEGLRRMRAALSPGITFREIAERAWQVPEPYRDTPLPALAHGVGLVNEYPLLLSERYWDSSGYDGIVEEGMVLCVESYLADKEAGEGVKLEQQVLIGPTGAEILSAYPMEEALL